MHSLDYNIERIIDFIQEHLKYYDRELLRKYVKEHESYGTFDYAIDIKNNIVAIVRWNMDGNIAEVLDFAVREDYRNKKVGRDFIIRAMVKFPQIEILKFKRGVRGDERKRNISVKAILKRNIF